MESSSGAHLPSTEPPPPQPLPSGIIGEESNSNWGVTYVMCMLAGVLYYLGTLLDSRLQRYWVLAASLFFLGVAVLAFAGYPHPFTRNWVEILSLCLPGRFSPVGRVTHLAES